MYKRAKVVAVIPARANSSFRGKNIKLLNGRPLLYYSIQPALDSQLIDSVIVSTENKEIAKVSRELGAGTPFLRPAELSKNGVPSNEALFHAAKYLYGIGIDVVVYMQPTDLFKKTEWIDECIRCLVDNKCSSALIVCKDYKNYWLETQDNVVLVRGKKDYTDRQNKQPLYREDSGLGSAISIQTLIGRSRLGDSPHLIPKDYTLFDIHTYIDIALAEAYLKHTGV